MTLSTQFLRENYAVNLQTGRLVNRKTGMTIGAVDQRGRVRFYVGNKQYAMKRVVWQLLTGEAPSGKVVSADGVATNIAWDNLFLQKDDGCVIRARDAIISPDAVVFGRAEEPEACGHG